jgi:hypothetical protein
MEVHPDKPGLIEILTGEAGEFMRILLTIAVCLLFVLIVVGAEALFR